MKNNILKSITVLLILLFFSLSANSQTPSIKGVVMNTQKEPLEFVSVVLMHPKDSTMITFTTTDIKGSFEIKEKAKDSVLLQLFSTGYIPYFKNIVYKNESIDFGTITLEENIGMLDEVVITAVVPMQIKKDTIAFNASSFKVNYDDNIEELLKKLPGMEIDSDGKVIAQGNEVAKIFVDGKEFFGGDPAIVLKNLPADAIAKIEVIDKNSEEAELTGVSDGNKQVVINFSLKKTKKKRGFGKASAGIGLDNRYFGNLNYNQFSDKTQLSVIGKFNNINITGSNIQDFLKNSDGLGDESDEDNNQKQKKLSGFLTTAVGGLHYGYEFKKDESFNVDYFYNYSENHGESNSQRTTFSNSNSFDINSENNFANSNEKHNFNLNYKNRSNKKNRLLVKGKIFSENRNSEQTKDSDYFNSDEEKVINNDVNSSSFSVKKSATAQANYYQNINENGRNFNTGFNATVNEYNIERSQTTIANQKLNTDNPIEKTTFTSRNEVNNQNQVNFNFKYTEPLGGNHYLRIETAVSNKKSKQDANQNKTITTTTLAEESLDFVYNYDELTYKTKLSHSYNSGKINFNAGIERYDLNRSFGEPGKEIFKTNNIFYNPVAFIQYIPKKGKKYKLSYKQIIRSPSASKSTTVINDLNPNFIRKGNPNLLPEKNHNADFLTIIHDYTSSSSFFAKVNFQYITDAIIQTVQISDEDFIKTSSFENSGVRKRISTTLNYSNKINNFGIRYTLKNKNSYNTSNSIVNLILNDVVSKDFSLGLSFENFKKSTFDVKIGSDYSINNTEFSIKSDLNREYIKQRYYSTFDYDFSKKLNFNTQFDYFVFSDNRFSSNQKLPLLNSAVSYAFNKSNILKVVMIDLLNKNIDINRRSSLNYFEETTTQSLGRYFIISYTYRLNSGPKKKKKIRKNYKKSF
jgi:hypothetical protein